MEKKSTRKTLTIFIVILLLLGSITLFMLLNSDNNKGNNNSIETQIQSEAKNPAVIQNQAEVEKGLAVQDQAEIIQAKIKKQDQAEVKNKHVEVVTANRKISFDKPVGWVVRKWQEDYDKLSLSEKREFIGMTVDADTSSTTMQLLDRGNKMNPFVSIGSLGVICDFSTSQWGQINFYLKDYNVEGYFSGNLFKAFDGDYKKWSKIKKDTEKTVYKKAYEYVVDFGKGNLIGANVYGLYPQEENISKDEKDKQDQAEKDFDNKVEQLIFSIKIK